LKAIIYKIRILGTPVNSSKNKKWASFRWLFRGFGWIHLHSLVCENARVDYSTHFNHNMNHVKSQFII